jgi:hypothetical protein
MAYTWDEVRQSVEREENARLERELAEREIRDGRVPAFDLIVARTRPGLEIAGAVVAGLHVALMTLVFNFLLFVWILHVNFDY